jgi:two-component system cell cycle sensor histidine kinase/response regulator CckA
VALSPHGLYLILAAAGVGLGGLLLPSGPAGLGAFAVAGTLAALALILRMLAGRQEMRDNGLHAQLADFIAHDASPSFTTDMHGEVRYQNRTAVERFGSRGGQTLTRALSEIFANPASVLHRLQTRAEATGAAREDMVTRRGHVRLAVHRIGEAGFLWRLEDMAERATGGRGAESISLPMLTVSKTGTILFMNEALRRITGERVKTLDRILTDLPVRPGEEHEIAGATGPVKALVAEVEGQGGRREIYFLPAQGNVAGTHDPTAFDRLPVALLRLTPTGALRELNRAARALIGDHPAGTQLADLLEGLGRSVSDWLADAMNGRAENRPEVLRLRGRDEDEFLQVMLSRVVEDGRAGLMAVLSDATQLKTLEAQFVQSQKMQAIGQLAGGVAHDFNNLLTAISGHCDLLLLRHDRSDPDHADLTQINQNANRAASLVGQLLAFSRKQTLKPAVIDLRDTLSDLTHLLNRLVGEKVDLTLVHDPALSPIRADKRQLEQVLMNLVVNARDAMPNGGRIEISTENVALADDLRRDRATVPAGKYVVVRVADQGTGIAPDKLQKIFEPFYTTKRPGEGTGLGLSTAYGIVKQTGGYIFCDSIQEEGTTFALFFPAHEACTDRAEDETAAPIAARLPASAGQGVILLVEDEAPVRAFASRALKMRGYTVIEAENAEEALKLLDDRGLSVDVFVTDVIMPGMDGPSWVREALKERPDTRVVFVSGYSEEALTEERDRIPNSVFLPKPFSLSELTATVQNQLH